MISGINSTAGVYQSYSNLSAPQTQAYTSVSNVYKADTFSFSNIVPKDETAPYDPNTPPAEPYKPRFFDRPEVRIGGMMLGVGAVGGGLGYAIGSAFGRAGLGASIGAGVGVIAPVAMLAYALYSWGKGGSGN